MSQRIHPGLCSVTFRDLGSEALVERAAANGVAAIEWGADVHVPVGETGTARKVAGLCRDAGIACPSYGTYVRAGTAGAPVQFADALRTAVALGARNLRVWAGTVSGPEADAATWDAVQGDLLAMAHRAGDAGVTVSVEYHRNTLTETAEDTARLFAACDHPNLFSYWQPVPGRGLAAWQEELRQLAPWLGYVHVFHWLPATPRDERRPLAEAEDDWKALLSTWTPAAHWPHDRTAFLEFVQDDSAEAFTADMAVLRCLCRQESAMKA